MAATDNIVKQIILDISQLDGTINDIDPTSKLSGLGFNGNMCNSLAQRLNASVQALKASAFVNNSEITSDMSVQDVMDLVTQKVN